LVIEVYAAAPASVTTHKNEKIPLFLQDFFFQLSYFGFETLET
jgi:hypothetical protein